MCFKRLREFVFSWPFFVYYLTPTTFASYCVAKFFFF
jgi:hypothetical protein